MQLRSLILAQAGGTPPPSFFDPTMLPVFAAIALIWWFVLLRPQRQQEKAHRAMVDSLSVGQKVVTQAGIYGTVAQLGEKTIKLKVADNVRIEVSRSSIAGPQPGETAGAEKDA